MKRMMKVMCAALLAGTAAMVTPVFAEDAKPAGLNPDDVKKALGLSIYLQGGYTYNGDASSSGPFDDTGKGEQNDLRVYDHKANSFVLDLVELVFQKDPAIGGAGYKLKLSAGETAKLIHAAGMGAAGESIDVTEAYISYTAAIGKGLRFDLGKMGTFVGAEVMEAKDNPNYSRSFLYNYAEPLTHTGLKASYAFTDALNAGLFIVNGWDNATDNNKGKSYGVSVNFAPAEIFSGYVNVLTGPEQDAQGPNAPTVGSANSNNRSLVDLVATIKPLKPLSIILNYDTAREQNVPGAVLPSGTSAGVKWSGFSGIVKYDIDETYSVSVRGETFNDNNGFRTGTVQKLSEVTLTPEIRLKSGIILKPEYRHDKSDQYSFDNNKKKTQNTLALGVMYAW